MDDYAGRVLADRYRLPLPPSDEYELTETRAFDTYSGQEVLIRQVPLPEVVEAEVLDADGLPAGFTARDGLSRRPPARTATRRPADPAVRRAVEAAQAAARIPDHPRLDQVFDVFAEGGSLWVVSELVAARPLAALLAEKPLTPYRAAEVASDIATALRVLHAHGWVHRNITARTVLVCDDGRVMLTGLAVGAAEEALCGYDPVPAQDDEADPAQSGDAAVHGVHGGFGGAGGAAGPGRGSGDGGAAGGGRGGGPDGWASGGGPRWAAAPEPTGEARGGHGGAPGPGPGGAAGPAADPEAARRAAIEARAARGPAAGTDPGYGGGAGALERRSPETGADVRAARAGAIAAYRAGARAAARVQEAQQGARAALPGSRPPGDDPRGAGGPEETPYAPGSGAGTTLPGRPVDPHGVHGPAWRGSAPGAGGIPAPGGPGARTALPGPGSGAGGPGSAAGALPAPGGFAGGGRETGGAAFAAAAERDGAPGAGVPQQGRWDEQAARTPVRRGPGTALAAERARQARMAVVGAVTERWAPEQAGPVHENWQLAAPIGPATDLWALGALLFRAVQGHAPYPEESTAELVQLVCAEPPAFAEECGPLRPVVESLLRQDPTERIDFEELNGWLRSLVRSAPEPEAGAHVVAAPPADPSRLPIVRRRGELVRRRRAGLPAHHGRHKRDRRPAGSPRRLGRTLLLLILLALAAAIAYAALFMPKAGDGGTEGGGRTGAVGEASEAPPDPGRDAGSAPRPDRSAPGGDGASQSAGSAETQTTDPRVADGFTLRRDPEGFQVAVADGWSRTPRNGRAQVVYSHGGFELLVVPGRDSAAEFGSDPMAYQRDKEGELQGYRDSSWATSSGLRTIEVGGRTMAEGQFTWTDASGRDLFVRNVAILLGGRYHVVQVRGPESQRDEVTRLFEQAAATYRFTG
ncbi:protein kinase [Streptomyces sp. NPDC046831]|uniref:protein kinase n=1 Tax=Streptomyces sp. NPDC046831 TaxID=3154805 RepID=UPI00340036FB